jgi:hypothetical protein
MSEKDDEMRTIVEIGLSNLLSFGPDTQPIALKSLNVLIGPYVRSSARAEELVTGYGKEIQRGLPPSTSLPEIPTETCRCVTSWLSGRRTRRSAW